jgi:hypothetical protein
MEHNLLTKELQLIVLISGEFVAEQLSANWQQLSHDG